ncbi:MAG TPA: adenylate/guanylate cyclase domain-containing protein [Candidatus Limnocylindrales bacterium]|nr:adenylate/guanylate cyclase domain-containing protein [Candidatus Limnocylindrales bacterium]
MTKLERASLLDPANQRPLSRGVGAAAHVGGLAIGRAILEPGWRWSEDVKPIVGTEWCEVHHLQLVISGRLAVRLADSDEADEFVAGDLIDIPPGHDAWVVGDEPTDLIDLSGTSAQFGLPASLSRQVVTMLMSDIVDSTPTAARLGDARWRQTLADHNRIVRREIERFRGREIDTTGDGFFVAFDSAAGAVQCARAIRDAVKRLDLEVRIGVHTGEIEMTADGVRGIAIHALARIMSAAGASEILVSPITKALTEGTDLTFVDRGPHSLKGIAAPMELFTVE